MDVFVSERPSGISITLIELVITLTCAAPAAAAPSRLETYEYKPAVEGRFNDSDCCNDDCVFLVRALILLLKNLTDIGITRPIEYSTREVRNAYHI